MLVYFSNVNKRGKLKAILIRHYLANTQLWEFHEKLYKNKIVTISYQMDINTLFSSCTLITYL